ncbi:BA14K family protein [Oricola cellulosilytica]|uniref:Lectin-like protein BA14k n=1 Tax=Oricola cellulosilytica TaxID=1429082 RepID=A0A4R0PF86_9HYPH|nr:BA14K family protein [Oricola cellulosilytica]TCD15318.1 BA14K family protein [Oricola cellulosilytica]
MTRLFNTRTLKTVIAALAVSATALSPLTAAPAYAGDRGLDGDAPGWDDRGDSVRHIYRNGRYYRDGRYRHGRRYHRRNRDGDAAAAALLGIAGAAIIAGALSSRPQREIYVAPDPYPPRPRGPKVITYAGSLEPWTAGWYEWCDNRYRSFNPQTGTYRGYDGRDHFCVPK